MSIEIERKFLVGQCPDWSHPLLASGRRIAYEQVYLRVSATVEERVRRCSAEDDISYQHAVLRRISPGVREIDEEEIDDVRYGLLRSRRDPGRHIIAKERTCFVIDDQLFELDDIRQPVSRACFVLEAQVRSESQVVRLPDFLDIDREVTFEPEYANSWIALG